MTSDLYQRSSNENDIEDKQRTRIMRGMHACECVDGNIDAIHTSIVHLRKQKPNKNALHVEVDMALEWCVDYGKSIYRFRLRLCHTLNLN